MAYSYWAVLLLLARICHNKSVKNFGMLCWKLDIPCTNQLICHKTTLTYDNM